MRSSALFEGIHQVRYQGHGEAKESSPGVSERRDLAVQNLGQRQEHRFERPTFPIELGDGDCAGRIGGKFRNRTAQFSLNATVTPKFSGVNPPHCVV